MTPYMLSEIPVLLGDHTQLPFLGKEHCNPLGKRMHFSLYSTNLFRELIKRIKNKEKVCFSLLKP